MTLLELRPEDDHRRARALRALSSAEIDLGEPAAPDHAAEAETFLANILWQVARRDDAHAAARRALDLLRDQPPSHAKAAALVERSRLAMLAGESDEAIDVGRPGLELARQFADERLQARALITIGTALGHRGGDGIRELTLGIEIAERANAMTEFVRGNNNLAQERLVTGDLAGTIAIYDAVLDRIDRLGLTSGISWVLGQKISASYFTGAWDEVEPISARFKTVVARMPGHYLEHQIAVVEAAVMSARDQPEAEAAWVVALELASKAGDPQAIGPPLAQRARVLLDSGRPSEVPGLVEQVLALQDEQGALYYTWLIELAWLLLDFGREAEMPTTAHGGVWLEVSRAIVRGELVEAADVFERMGFRVAEAYTRLRIAEKLASVGRHAEARPQLDRALSFYRSVGAAAYVRRGETLLLASA